jgi:hypothetical protein
MPGGAAHPRRIQQRVTRRCFIRLQPRRAEERVQAKAPGSEPRRASALRQDHPDERRRQLGVGAARAGKRPRTRPRTSCRTTAGSWSDVPRRSPSSRGFPTRHFRAASGRDHGTRGRVRGGAFAGGEAREGAGQARDDPPAHAGEEPARLRLSLQPGVRTRVHGRAATDRGATGDPGRGDGAACAGGSRPWMMSGAATDHGTCHKRRARSS